MPVLRLDKLLSGQGLCARSEVKDLLRRGLVRINGQSAVSVSQKVDSEKDTVEFEGRKIAFREHSYVMMNKPQGVISASSDPKQRTVLDLLPEEMRRPGLFPAGRLDKDTVGLLLITDDGAFAHEILSPRRHVEKKYFVVTEPAPDESDAAAFAQGMVLEKNEICREASLSLGDGGAYVTLHEGKYHQIKRMFEARGKQVTFLKRLSVGGLPLDERLKPGQAREISDEELRSIKSDNP